MTKQIDVKVILADGAELKKKAFDVRREVFVVEQKVSTEEEFDEFEETSRHFVALTHNEEGVGAARWRVTEKGIKLERFAVQKAFRGMGVGSKLVNAVIEDITSKKGTGQYLYLHSQLDAVSLYAKYGFEKKGEQFEECDILHYRMEKYT